MSIQGTVKWFNVEKGYGFIKRDDGGPDVFVHATAVKSLGIELADGDRIEFDIVAGNNGKSQAGNVRLLPSRQSAA